MGARAVKQDLKQLETVAGKAGADTIRLWEGFREQALFWRALALIQVPSTALAILIALLQLYLSDPIINVVPNPLPGRYSSKELPDRLYLSSAQNLVNLISTYQPSIARRQFKRAEKMLWEPALSRFQKVMLENELRAIEETARSQIFFADEARIKIERFPEFGDSGKVVVRIPGVQQKLIGNRPLEAEKVVYHISMTTIPRHRYNKYGIVVINIDSRSLTFNEQ